MHKPEEIKQAGEKAIDNVLDEILMSTRSIKVPVSLPHEEDGILHKYNVFFKKEVDEKLGEVWSFTRYAKNA